MNAPLKHVSLTTRTDLLLAPPLEQLRLRLCLALISLDVLAIFGSFLAAGRLYLGDFPSEMAVRQATLIAPIFLIFAFHSGFYKIDQVSSLRRAAYSAIYIFGVSALTLIFITFYAKTTASFSRVVFTLGSGISLAAILTIRIGARHWMLRTIGPSSTNTLIIHAGGPTVRMDHAYHIDAEAHQVSPDASDPTNLDRLGRSMRNMDRVIVSCPHDHRDLWAPLLRAAGVQGEFVSDALWRLGALKLQVERGFSTVVVSARPLGIEARISKRLMDLVLSSIALLALAPLMIVVATLIRLEDGGPVLFVQRRMGRGNRFFRIYKFRSISVERSDADGVRSAERDDDRTTRIGRFIRRTSIDELPQLFNVWRGDMSLVGPRPHALGSQAGEKLFWEVDGRYWNRHVLKPGLTGLAQVRGLRGATESEQDLTDRLQADLEYISNWSFWLDAKILLQTARVLYHSKAY
jgi:exopolysaccharide biosynthesis polyprenyl glycosylphosphotransferase